jgi:hypothetical protein
MLVAAGIGGLRRIHELTGFDVTDPDARFVTATVPRPQAVELVVGSIIRASTNSNKPGLVQVREWCTGQAVERFDELRALRAEVQRLGELLTRAVAELRRRNSHAIAATIEHDLGIPVSMGPGSR